MAKSTVAEGHFDVVNVANQANVIFFSKLKARLKRPCFSEFKVVPDADGRERQLKQVVVDCVLTWEPKANTPVDMANVNETILKLARFYDIRAVTFDKWNSAGSIQMLQGVGIHAEDLSFSASQQFAMYRNLKLLFYNDMIQLPGDTEGLVKELQFLKVENNRITHDVYGKDRADALAAAAWTATGRQLSTVGQLVQESATATTRPRDRRIRRFTLSGKRFIHDRHRAAIHHALGGGLREQLPGRSLLRWRAGPERGGG